MLRQKCVLVGWYFIFQLISCNLLWFVVILAIEVFINYWYQMVRSLIFTFFSSITNYLTLSFSYHA